ncbi:MAG: LemA family protein [Planctomycetales bacterium]|nr:LemA family protein [Planctomycetales bacterium]
MEKAPSSSRWPVILGVLGVIALVVIAAFFWGTSVYNQLVKSQENMRSSWSQVETVLQRRYDLIPNLVNTVKGYASHEKEILEEVTRLRSQWGAAGTLAEKTKAAGELEGTLARLLVVAEQYPDLKANQNFRDLQFELAGTENRISVERQRYNDSVRAYNTSVRSFPGSLISSFAGFQPSDAYFEAASGAKTVPKVDFGTDAKDAKPKDNK